VIANADAHDLVLGE